MIARKPAKVVWSKVAWVALLASATHANAVLLSDGHVDLVTSYAGGSWEWLVRDEDFNEFPLAEVWFVAGMNTRTSVPENAAFTPILGPAGSPVWVLPQSFQPGKLFLGFDGSGTGAGVFSENRITLALQQVTGPGEFALYTLNGFGDPTAAMNTRDGIDSMADQFHLNSATGHMHYSWAFSAPGDYRIQVIASGTLADGGTVVSTPSEWRFQVIPEPTSATLSTLGAVSACLRRRRRRPFTEPPVTSPPLKNKRRSNDP